MSVAPSTALGEFGEQIFTDFSTGKQVLTDKMDKNRDDFLGTFRPLWKTG